MEDLGSSWDVIGTVALSTLAIYVTAVVTVRLAGRRTVAQLSAFDAVVTIALGSVIATTAVSGTTSYVEGATAFVVLLALQVSVAWLRRRSPLLRRLLEFEPEIVVRDGEGRLPRGPWTSQLTEDELWSRLRQQGVFHPEEVTLAVLEPNGALSVVRPRARVDRGVVPGGGPA